MTVALSPKLTIRQLGDVIIELHRKIWAECAAKVPSGPGEIYGQALLDAGFAEGDSYQMASFPLRASADIAQRVRGKLDRTVMEVTIEEAS